MGLPRLQQLPGATHSDLVLQVKLSKVQVKACCNNPGPEDQLTALEHARERECVTGDIVWPLPGHLWRCVDDQRVQAPGQGCSAA